MNKGFFVAPANVLLHHYRESGTNGETGDNDQNAESARIGVLDAVNDAAFVVDYLFLHDLCDRQIGHP
uniref:Uncharacterized protein n=1 Tax=Romanomermis culicivorax TaxID=13658 RepID=A0A915IYW6_ROMCU